MGENNTPTALKGCGVKNHLHVIKIYTVNLIRKVKGTIELECTQRQPGTRSLTYKLVGNDFSGFNAFGSVLTTRL